MFSPDGRLLQVEYAKKTVKQGSTAIGMVCSDGVLLVTDKRIVDPLVVADAIEKIFQIDDHIGATASGIISDARVLIENAQLRAQQHHVTYDAPIDTVSIVKNICDLKQLTTQSGGYRPFGVSLLVAGIDADGPKLFETDPTGIYFQYHAVVIGEGEEAIEAILHKRYKQALTLHEGLRLCVEALKSALDEKFNHERLDAAYIRTSDKKFTKIDKKELEKVFKQAK
jgi:proteasome alpha subunit